MHFPFVVTTVVSGIFFSKMLSKSMKEGNAGSVAILPGADTDQETGSLFGPRRNLDMHADVFK